MPRKLVSKKLAAKKSVSKKSVPTSNEASIPSKLSEGEQDLLSHLEGGYELQTDTLGGNPVLRHLKSNEVVRPASANRNTIKGLEDRGLIVSSEGREPLTLVWRIKKKAK
jgi:hypothetical protein